MKPTTRIKAFLLGMWEFRSDCTTYKPYFKWVDVYDAGREFMHIITFRHFDY